MKQKDKPSSSRISGNAESMTWFDKLSMMKRDLVCIGIMLLVVYVLFFKIIFSGYVFSSESDTAAAESWSQAIHHIDVTEHVEPLWVPYIFSGMPVFGPLLFPKQVNYLETLIQYVSKIFFLSANPWYVPHYFLAGLFMYLLARNLRFTPLPSLFAGLVAMLSPSVIGFAESGHGSKLVVFSYFSLLFLLTYRLFEKRNILNFGLLAAAVGMTLLDRHPQMAFYGLLAIGVYLLYDVVLDVKQKQPMIAGKKVALFVIAVAIGVAIYSYEFLPTEEYAKFSIRGGSGDGKVSSGLSYDYATNWSLHPFEMVTYVIPSFFGFSSSYVTDWQGQERALPLYWGWMPLSDAPPYIGLIPVLLSIIALMYRRNKMTWFFAILTGIVFLISFGNYFGVLYNLLFYYLPFFNKFRAPSMILYLTPLTIGILAAYGLSFLMELRERSKEFDTVKFRKNLMKILAVLGGLLVIGFIAKSSLFGFFSGSMLVKQGEVRQYGQQVVDLFKEKRFDLLWNDFVKMMIIAGVFLYGIVLLIDKKISQSSFVGLCIAVTVVDLLMLDLKFINPQPPTAMEEHFQPDATTQFLQADSSLYRIYPLGELFQDNTYMYHAITSIGGYSPAKLKMYQELIDSTFFHGSDPQFPLNMNVIDMLNTKYLVAGGRLPERFTLVNGDQAKKILTYLNPQYLPRAWFVDSTVIALSKTDVFYHLNDPSWNPRTTAILEKQLPQPVMRSDSTSAQLTAYATREISFDVYASKPSLLVVSEVYYPAGWKAFVDGAETEIFKTNYVLRSLVVPGGKHTVVFRFNPETLEKGYTITQAAWGVSFLLILAGLFQSPWLKAKLRSSGKAKGDGEKETIV